MRDYSIVVIPGDGIGPEIVEAAMSVLRAVEEREGDFSLNFQEHGAGAAYYEKHGIRISEETLEACRSSDGILKGPVGDPSVRTPEGTEAGILGAALGGGLDTYANVRPIKLFPGVFAPLWDVEAGKVDYLLVKEHTEGFLASQDKGVGGRGAMVDSMLFTRGGIERVVRFAFEVACRRDKTASSETRRVTCVDKSNVLRSYAFFREIFFEVAREYPDIQTEAIYSDACAHDLIRHPDHFDVLVTDYFIGDILSDLGAATVGGLGMCPSGCFGEHAAYFDSVHGTAPRIAGKGAVNPLGQTLASAMLLDKIGKRSASRRVEDAIWKMLKAGDVRLDKRGRAPQGTQFVADAIVSRIMMEPK